MMTITSAKVPQETEQMEAVKQPEKAAKGNPAAGVEKTEDSGKAQKTEAVSARPPEFDRYVPEDKEEKSYGHYEVVSDETGNSTVRFDDPDKNPKEKKSVDQMKEKDSDGPGQEQKLQKLKKKRQQLKQKIKSETDPGKSEELKRKLADIEQKIKASQK